MKPKGDTMEPMNTTGTNSSAGVMERVRERATAQMSTQKDRATDGLTSIAHAVRQSTQPFRDNQQDAIAGYIDKAAEQLERFSTRLRERDINEVMNDVQQFARRQPAIFIGASFAAGLLAARFLKSSSGNSEALVRHDTVRPAYEPTTSRREGYAGGGL
jgi:ElaB/YqjD/DUF883 family membrane-anchored ribosome-binding protein